MIFANFAGSVLRNVSVNEIFHQRQPASVTAAAVIKPNVDTIYSRVVVDLSHQDLVLTVANVTDGRYFVYPVLDAFGNVIAEIGVVNNNGPGDYLIRRADDVFGPPGFFNSSTSPDFNATRYKGVVNVPTTYGTMLIRFLLFQNTTDEINTVHKYQDASKIVAINRTSVNTGGINQTVAQPAPFFNTTSLNGSFLGIATPLQQLNFAAKLIPYNQALIYSDRSRVFSILTQAGLYNGS